MAGGSGTEKIEAVEWAERIAPGRLITIRRPAQATIIAQGDHDDSLYIILRGRVEVTKHLLSGEDIFVRELGRGQYFGELAALDPAPRSATVQTIEACEFAVLSRADLVRAIESDGKLAMKLLIDLARRARLDDERLDIRRPVSERLKTTLRRLCRIQDPASDAEPSVLLRSTRAELATRSHADVKTISRELTRLEKDGVLAREGRAIRVFRSRLNE